MARHMLSVCLLATLACLVNSFSPAYTSKPIRGWATSLKVTWQETLDELVDIDTPYKSKPRLAKDLLFSFKAISEDVFSAVKDRDFEKIAPSNLGYSKNLKNASAFQKQLVTDIIPDLVTDKVPRMFFGVPSLAKKALNIRLKDVKAVGNDIKNFVTQLNDQRLKSSNLLQSFKTELKNMFKSTPEGYYSPPYEVVKSATDYEIRKYEAYSVVSTPLTDGIDADISILNSFFELFKYFFGGENDMKLSLPKSCPLITEDGNMAIVLPNELTSLTAPKPNSPKVLIQDIPHEIVAVKRFSGFATNKEVSQQRAKLEDALLADGIVYENYSFKTLTYNPPFTLPWMRRNEVSVKVEFTKSAA